MKNYIIFKNIEYIHQKLRIIKKISKLNIEHAGLDADGMPFVKLINGPIFFGRYDSTKIKKYYRILPKKTKKVLPDKCFQVALDIVIRYIEGGLKLGGPPKDKFYQVQPGDIVAEMGAYMGYYSMNLAEKVTSNGKVIAIEPLKDNLKYLKKNIEANTLSNIIIINKGVWKEKNKMLFYRRSGDNQSASLALIGSNKEKFELEVDCLDNIFDEIKINNIDHMIIQLNGVEFEALEGLTKLKPKNLAIAARYKKDGRYIAPIIKALLEYRGYKVNVVNKDFIFGFKK